MFDSTLSKWRPFGNAMESSDGEASPEPFCVAIPCARNLKPPMTTRVATTSHAQLTVTLLRMDGTPVPDAAQETSAVSPPSLDPVWDESSHIPAESNGVQVQVEVWDQRTVHFHGVALVPVTPGPDTDKWYRLKEGAGVPAQGGVGGDIRVRLHYFGQHNRAKQLFIVPERGGVDYKNLIEKDDPEECFTDMERIGKGGFSVIYKAKRRDTEDVVAVKVVDIERSNFSYLMEEIIVHKAMKHPNVVQFRSAYSLPHKQQIWICMEYMEGSSVYQMIKRGLSPMRMALVLQETLKALAYVHSMGKVHRDVKSDNILFGRNGCVKLADFGFATNVDQKFGRKDIVGSFHWLAPEILLRQPITPAMDIWALGVVAFEMIHRDPPYWGLKTTVVLKRIKRNGVALLAESSSSDWPPLMLDFFKQCVAMSVDDRPSATQLLQHPWLLKWSGKHREGSESSWSLEDAVAAEKVAQSSREDHSLPMLVPSLSAADLWGEEGGVARGVPNGRLMPRRRSSTGNVAHEADETALEQLLHVLEASCKAGSERDESSSSPLLSPATNGRKKSARGDDKSDS